MIEKTKIKKLDIHCFQQQYDSAMQIFKNSKINDVNKQLILDHITDCQLGWRGSQKPGKPRTIYLLQTMRGLTEMLESIDPGLTWHDLQMNHTKQILCAIEDKGLGEWSIKDHQIILRKFVTWLRKERGYPEGYPNRERLISQISWMKYPPEVEFKILIVRKRKSPAEIPSEDEVKWLIQVWDDVVKPYPRKTIQVKHSIRNKAILAVLADSGCRIGGLGNLRIGDITFDEIGAKMIITDKTMQNEPVRLVLSAQALKDWWALHPWKSKPESPLWIDLETNKLLSYDELRGILKKSRDLHNKFAEEKGLPPITKKLTPHLFRYHAQTRDMLAGMPLSVQCTQRGWSPSSDMPQMYARLTTDMVDEWMMKHYGMNTKNLEQIIETKIEQVVGNNHGMSKKPERTMMGPAMPPKVDKAKSCITCTTKYPGCQSTCVNKPFLFPG